jgi:hypothetical protein
MGASPAGLDRACWGHALGLAGRREEAEKLASSLVESPIHQALVYSGLGDKDRTFQALNDSTVLGPIRMGRTLTFPEFCVAAPRQMTQCRTT